MFGEWDEKMYNRTRGRSRGSRCALLHIRDVGGYVLLTHVVIVNCSLFCFLERLFGGGDRVSVL